MIEPALVQFKFCTASTPTNSTCQFHLGLAYSDSGNFKAAESALRLALQDPDFRHIEAAKAALVRVSAE